MNTLNQFFDKVFCITCFGDTDRQNSCSLQFEKYKINFQWVISVDNTQLINNGYISTGELSLYLSHLNCFRQSKINGYKRFCIFEDDFLLYDDWEARFNLFINELPEKWDILQMGEPDWIKHVYPITEEFYTENCSLCLWACTSHFMGFNNSIYDRIFDFKFDYPIDIKYCKMMDEKNTYVPSKKRLANAISIPHERFHKQIPDFDPLNYIPSKLRDVAVSP